MWCIGSGVSFHMICNKEFFSRLEEKDMQLHMKLGDDGRYMTKGLGTISFKREFSSLLHLNNVIYVPGLKKNLLSIIVLEDKGCDVVFSKGKAYLNNFA